MAMLWGAGDRRGKREKYLKIAQALIDKRKAGGFDGDWQLLSQWLAPRRVRFKTDEKNRSSLSQKNIIDSTGGYALRTFQSGLHAGLTSPARPWMSLTLTNKDKAERPNVKAWLHNVTQRVLSICQQTNVYQALPSIYGDLGAFATGAMAILEDDDDLFRCYNYALGSWAIGLNARGLPSTWVHEYRLTVRQLVERFGQREDGKSIDWSGISKRVQDDWDRGDYENEIDVTWVVMPNPEHEPKALDYRRHKFLSCHLETHTNEDKLLRESGFRTFPVMVPRWESVGGDIYGTDCPGITAFGDIRQLQIMQRRKAQAIHKMVDPPLVGPPELRTQKTSLLAGDITYVASRDGHKALGPLHEVTLNIEHLRLDTYETRELIRRAFYEDLFLMLQQRNPAQRGLQPITAREVEELDEEKLVVLGPALDRMNDELHDPFIDRVWDVMVANGLIGDPPAEIEGEDLKVEYTSILAQAQKMLGVRNVDAFIDSTMRIAASAPEAASQVLGKINFYAVVDEYGDRYSVSPRLIRPDLEAQELTSQAAQPAMVAQGAETAAMMARAAKDAAAAPMSGQTALSQAMGEMVGAA